MIWKIKKKASQRGEARTVLIENEQNFYLTDIIK